MTKRAVCKSVAVLAILVVLVAACSDGETVRSGDGPTPRDGDGSGFFGAMREPAEEQEPAEEPEPPSDQDEAAPASTTTSAPRSETTPPRDAEPRTSPRLVSSGDVTVPDGDPGMLSVVMTGPPRHGSLPVVVRNRTSDSLHEVEVTGTARDADGSLIGSGRSLGLSPSRLDPGEWGFGYVYFGFDDAPEDADFELTATGRTEPGFLSTVDLLPVELNQVAGSFSRQIVGIVENDADHEVSGPISVTAACFDPSGTELRSTEQSYADGDDLPTGGTASFAISLFDDDCPVFVVASSGYDW